MDSQTTVSLPEHLRSTLKPLRDILPEDLRSRVLPHLTESITEISHTLLSDISKWARKDEAHSRLRARNLDPGDYSIIALLAGTITSPSSKLPPYTPPDDAAAIAKRSTNDRKVITAIMNALLSIGGSGYAGWWASSRTGWRDEWRVLFGLLVASVVAISETVLYLIWQSRVDGPRRPRVQAKVKKERQHDKGSDEGEDDHQEGNDVATGLRKRNARVIDE